MAFDNVILILSSRVRHLFSSAESYWADLLCQGSRKSSILDSRADSDLSNLVCYTEIRCSIFELTVWIGSDGAGSKSVCLQVSHK